MEIRTKFKVGDKVVGISKVWVKEAYEKYKGVGR